MQFSKVEFRTIEIINGEKTFAILKLLIIKETIYLRVEFEVLVS